MAASATLAQIVPPSTVLVVLGDQLNISYQRRSWPKGDLAPNVVSVSDLFAGAVGPACCWSALSRYLIVVAVLRPATCPAVRAAAVGGARQLLEALLAPVALIVAVLGSILCGIATPTEAARSARSVRWGLRAQNGFANCDAGRGKDDADHQYDFSILIGATLFSLVFRALGGDDMVIVR